MANPYAWAILSVCTIGSMIFAVYTWVKGKSRKELSYITASYPLIESGKRAIPKVKIHYNDEEIRDLSITKFAVWNSGNEVLNDVDIVSSKCLRIESKHEQQILEAMIVAESEESNHFRVENKTHDQIDIAFDYAEKQDGFVIQILHTGDIDDLRMTCKIKGGKELRNIRPKVRRRVRRMLSKILYPVMTAYLAITINALAICAFLAFFSPELHKFVYEMPSGGSLQTEVSFSIVLALLAVVYDCMAFMSIKRYFGLNIPTKLRQHVNTKYIDPLNEK